MKLAISIDEDKNEETLPSIIEIRNILKDILNFCIKSKKLKQEKNESIYKNRSEKIHKYIQIFYGLMEIIPLLKDVKYEHTLNVENLVNRFNINQLNSLYFRYKNL